LTPPMHPMPVAKTTIIVMAADTVRRIILLVSRERIQRRYYHQHWLYLGVIDATEARRDRCTRHSVGRLVLSGFLITVKAYSHTWGPFYVPTGYMYVYDESWYKYVKVLVSGWIRYPPWSLPGMRSIPVSRSLVSPSPHVQELPIHCKQNVVESYIHHGNYQFSVDSHHHIEYLVGPYSGHER
jgi:hypothetical protein